MGNVLGTNYREPTGGDCAGFCGLTFDCWVNSRMKASDLLPEMQPEATGRWMFITPTPLTVLCSLHILWMNYS